VFSYEEGAFVDKKWSDIKVGDVVKAEKDKEFPSDLMLLGAPKEVVFVDTMNLDGETNLKEKFAFTKDFKEDQIFKFEGHVVCDRPNESLDEWDGNSHFSGKVLNSK
jgi:P-type E1-E2 ATPase